MLFLLAVIIFVAFLISFVTVGLCRSFFGRVGVVDEPGGRKHHQQTVPYGGGIGIFIGVALPLVTGYIAAVYFPQVFTWGPFSGFFKHLPGAFAIFPRLAAILAGGLVLVVLGFLDDVKNLSPVSRLAVEFLVAGSLVWGFEINATFFLHSRLLSNLASVVWIVAVTNAFNLIDNMDGYSGGVAAITSFFFFLVACQTGQVFIAILFGVLIGSSLGFLRHNFPPAKIFMGDAGALFLGYFISVGSILFTYYEGGSGVFSVVMPVVVLAVPIYDTLSVIYVRLRAGRPIFQADRSHFSHRLLDTGMSPRRALFTIYLITIATGMNALNLYQVDQAGAVNIFLQTGVLIGVLFLLENLSGYGGKK